MFGDYRILARSGNAQQPDQYYYIDRACTIPSDVPFVYWNMVTIDNFHRKEAIWRANTESMSKSNFNMLLAPVSMQGIIRNLNENHCKYQSCITTFSFIRFKFSTFRNPFFLLLSFCFNPMTFCVRLSPALFAFEHHWNRSFSLYSFFRLSILSCTSFLQSIALCHFAIFSRFWAFAFVPF